MNVKSLLHAGAMLSAVAAANAVAGEFPPPLDLSPSTSAGTSARSFALYDAAPPVGFYAKVLVVESSYMPDTVAFIMDGGDAACPAKNWVVWNKGVENNKAIFASLMTAMASGKYVNFYHDAGSCTPAHLHVVDSPSARS